MRSIPAAAVSPKHIRSTGVPESTQAPRMPTKEAKRHKQGIALLSRRNTTAKHRVLATWAAMYCDKAIPLHELRGFAPFAGEAMASGELCFHGAVCLGTIALVALGTAAAMRPD